MILYYIIMVGNDVSRPVSNPETGEVTFYTDAIKANSWIASKRRNFPEAVYDLAELNTAEVR